LADIMRLCWQRDPNVRPSFEVLKSKLEELYDVYRRHEEDQSQSQSLPQGSVGSQAKPKVGTGGGLLSRLRSASGSARKS
jgi:hypothetical protein